MNDETPARRARGRSSSSRGAVEAAGHLPADAAPAQAAAGATEAVEAAEAAEAAAMAEAVAEVAGDHGSTDGGSRPAPAASGMPVAPQHSPGTGAIRVERGGIEEVTAGSVEVRLGGIGRLSADDVYVQWGGIGAGRADTMSVEFGSVGGALARDLRVSQGLANNVVAREATLEQGLVRTLVAQHVTISRPSAVLLMIALRVTGDVRPLLDWRGAIVAGAAFALVSGAFRLVRYRR